MKFRLFLLLFCFSITSPALLPQSFAAGGINLSTGSIVQDGSPGTILTSTGINFTVTSPGNGSCQPGENISRAFDGSFTSKYCANYYSTWAPAIPNEIVINYANGKVNISGLIISTANDAPHRNPKSWDLYGSNDGISWSLLATNTYSDETLDSLNIFSDYPLVDIAHSNSYSQIKFVVNSIRDSSVGEYGSPVVQYSELKVFGIFSPVNLCTYKGNSGSANNSIGGSKSSSPASSKSQGSGACQNSASRN